MPDLTIARVTGPVWWRLICRWITEHHRHHDPPPGWRYGLVAISADGTITTHGSDAKRLAGILGV